MTTLEALRDCEFIDWTRNDYGNWDAIALDNRAEAHEWVAGVHHGDWFITTRALNVFIETNL